MRPTAGPNWPEHAEGQWREHRRFSVARAKGDRGRACEREGEESVRLTGGARSFDLCLSLK